MLVQDLRINRLRSVLTGLSMFVGIVAVILSVLTGTVGGEYLKSTNEQLYGLQPSVRIQITAPKQTSYKYLLAFNNILQNRFAGTATTLFNPEPNYTVNLVGNSNTSLLSQTSKFGTVDANFVLPSYNKVFRLPMTQGRWFHTDQSAQLEVVINKAAEKSFSDTSRALISLGSSQAVSVAPIIGIVNDGSDIPHAYINAIPVAFYRQDTWSITDMTVIIWNRNNVNLENLRSAIKDVMYDTLKGDIADMHIEEPMSVFQTVTLAIQIGFALTAALLLLVSSLGLINIGLASLEQRTEELLIRRALGATRTSIVSLVIGGVILLALIVSVVAVIVSAIAVYTVPLFLPHDSPVMAPTFPISAAIVAVVAALLTGIIGSIVPAVHASRIQPALALR